MSTVIRELFSHWIGERLGLDGMFCMLLLMGAFWFGHYALITRRPAERLVLGPLSIAFFVLAFLACGWTKYLLLLALGILSYFVFLHAGSSRSDGQAE
jgi:hypothetical protein